MLLQRWEAKIRRKEKSPQPGIELTTTRSWFRHARVGHLWHAKYVYKDSERYRLMSACADSAGWHGSIFFANALRPLFQENDSSLSALNSWRDVIKSLQLSFCHNIFLNYQDSIYHTLNKLQTVINFIHGSLQSPPRRKKKQNVTCKRKRFN